MLRAEYQYRLMWAVRNVAQVFLFPLMSAYLLHYVCNEQQRDISE
jgi:hypothetical protein